MMLTPQPNSENTLLYQGQLIEVEKITEINTRHSDGMDFIFRDAEGQYYWRRELYDEDAGYYRAKREPERFHYRCYLHRVSLAAVILFQVDFAARRVLRLEVGALLASLRRKEAA